MKNFKRTKNNLKVISKKQELSKSPYFYISHANQDTNLKGIKSNLPKNQYLANSFSNIISKNKIKFPLKIYIYNSREELIKEIATQNKNILGFIKVNSNLFLNKKIIKIYNFELTAIYSKIN